MSATLAADGIGFRSGGVTRVRRSSRIAIAGERAGIGNSRAIVGPDETWLASRKRDCAVIFQQVLQNAATRRRKKKSWRKILGERSHVNVNCDWCLDSFRFLLGDWKNRDRIAVVKIDNDLDEILAM